MKRIILSSLVILGLVGAVAGATRAVFSDSDTVAGNTISVATLTVDAREVINKPLGDLNLLPGQWGNPGTVDLYNDGTSSQRQWMYVENISGDLCPYVTLKVGYSYAAQNVFDVTFGTYLLSSLNGDAGKILVGRSDPIAAGITTRLVQQPHVDSSAT